MNKFDRWNNGMCDWFSLLSLGHIELEPRFEGGQSLVKWIQEHGVMLSTNKTILFQVKSMTDASIGAGSDEVGELNGVGCSGSSGFQAVEPRW
ncbi:hypothetical protein Tco_1512201, partial [Tanacetum coccineum]